MSALKIISGIAVLILFIVLWECTPLRTKVYIAVNRLNILRARYKTSRFYCFCYRHRSIHLIEDFILSWIVFEWRDGWIVGQVIAFLKRIWSTILSFHGSFENIWNFLVFLSPYGREVAEDGRFRVPLDIFSMLVIITALLFVISVCFLNKYKVTGILLAAGITIVMWYIGFACCFLIVKIPVFYNVLAIFSAALIGITLGFAGLAVFDTTFKEIEGENKEGKG